MGFPVHRRGAYRAVLALSGRGLSIARCGLLFRRRMLTAAYFRQVRGCGNGMDGEGLGAATHFHLLDGECREVQPGKAGAGLGDHQLAAEVLGGLLNAAGGIDRIAHGGEDHGVGRQQGRGAAAGA